MEFAAGMDGQGLVACQVLLLESRKTPTLYWHLEEANTEVEGSTQALMRVAALGGNAGGR